MKKLFILIAFFSLDPMFGQSDGPFFAFFWYRM